MSTDITPDPYPVTKAVFTAIFAAHNRVFGHVPFDKGEIYWPTLLVVLVVTCPVWGPVGAAEWVTTSIRTRGQR